jgi:small subunit ribosomal protein S20
MPHSISAKKRVRQNLRRQARNRGIRSRIRTARREFLKAVAAGDRDAAVKRFRVCQRLVQRAAVNGPLHRNAAARIVGRLQKRLDAWGKAAPASPSAPSGSA